MHYNTELYAYLQIYIISVSEVRLQSRLKCYNTNYWFLRFPRPLTTIFLKLFLIEIPIFVFVFFFFSANFFTVDAIINSWKKIPRPNPLTVWRTIHPSLPSSTDIHIMQITGFSRSSDLLSKGRHHILRLK